eukprot:Blabericola_migrator_1__13534@NODE_98_length_14373_cov_122_493220_g88_i0_p10_GENE_NODE_98_length_14373_cov_122_493220_g88_i0NODE_98_length_14373_cov_122_493220_g88_i0_p10_ORF_typecomplete_len155_score24_14MAD/PF05557_13/4_6e05bZIP_1/PF00170_21/0_76bZIP_1/PF00170_21/0_29bZIP_1/PF00170_21/25Spc42p/PF11544_8/0_00016Spc42p/PF11544_8/1_6e02ATG16/PF08614_11/1_5ATG16/PF08614_11/0_0091DUF4686/PF15742_5/0_00042Cast/PF10174_9/0_00057HOOK/PF05622_12/0_001ADIP/PF11559_8/0_028ADIP/PF11559_8/3_5PKcGMP_CC/PF16
MPDCSSRGLLKPGTGTRDSVDTRGANAPLMAKIRSLETQLKEREEEVARLQSLLESLRHRESSTIHSQRAVSDMAALYHKSQLKLREFAKERVRHLEFLAEYDDLMNQNEKLRNELYDMETTCYILREENEGLTATCGMLRSTVDHVKDYLSAV